MLMIDDKTIDSARRGDRFAQAKLLNAMQDEWFRFCYALLGSERAAMRATQEVARRVLRSFPEFDPQCTFAGWTFRIAINVCREDPIDVMGLPQTNPIDDDPSDSEKSANDHARLHAVLAMLHRPQREVVLLRYFEQMNVRETALATGYADATVTSTLFKALRTLCSSLFNSFAPLRPRKRSRS